MAEYSEVAKKLGLKYRIGKYGIKFGRKIDPLGNHYGWKVVHIIPLTGWTFDPHEIIEAIANDPDMSIKYGESK